jgi:biopolymer transport protein ExbB
LSLAKGFTFSAWVRPAKSQTDARLFSWEDGKQSVIIAVDGMKLHCEVSGKASPAIDLPVSKWVRLSVCAEPGKELTIYTDGKQRATMKMSSMPEPASDIGIGASVQGKHGFAGDLDEVTIAGVCRSPAWVRAEALSQGPETPLLSFLDEESTSGGGESLTIHLLVVTAKAITLDGWLVIGLIVVMIGATWALFFNKFVLLRKTKKGNAAFSASFADLDNLSAMKGKEDDFPDSSLFRIYSAGISELDKRGKGPRAMTALQTALDKAVLQESKKNAAGLLVFTLSISGGPFMGLFGTVWGVINTFAGVAEAGEANLAAIAPGVASALACTLMGLTLAIPALFQYSYLSGEIKNISADVNQFTGEFINRAEVENGCDS